MFYEQKYFNFQSYIIDQQARLLTTLTNIFLHKPLQQLNTPVFPLPRIIASSSTNQLPLSTPGVPGPIIPLAHDQLYWHREFRSTTD